MSVEFEHWLYLQALLWGRPRPGPLALNMRLTDDGLCRLHMDLWCLSPLSDFSLSWSHILFLYSLYSLPSNSPPCSPRLVRFKCLLQAKACKNTMAAEARQGAESSLQVRSPPLRIGRQVTLLEPAVSWKGAVLICHGWWLLGKKEAGECRAPGWHALNLYREQSMWKSKKEL